MAQQEFMPGATVYSEFGQEAEYVARIAEGHIVRPLVEAHRGDEEYMHLCDPVTWRAAFAKPPIEKFSAELKSIHGQIEAARAALSEQQAEHRAFAATAKDRAIERARVEQLRYVDEFLTGKLTHYAVLSDYQMPHVLAVGDAKHGDRPYNREMRLLALYGKLDEMRTVYWQLHKYGDMSGSYGDTVVPSRSVEEAEGHIRAHIAKRLAEELKIPTYHAATMVEHANHWGVEVPAALQKLADDAKATAEARAIEKAQRDYAASVEHLKSLGVAVSA